MLKMTPPQNTRQDTWRGNPLINKGGGGGPEKSTFPMGLTQGASESTELRSDSQEGGSPGQGGLAQQSSSPRTVLL